MYKYFEARPGYLRLYLHVNFFISELSKYRSDSKEGRELVSGAFFVNGKLGWAKVPIR